MGVWFQQNFTGEVIEWITGLTYEGTQEMEATFQQLYAYVSTYAIVGLFFILVGLLALLISLLIKKLMNGAH
ncbi:MAG: POT family proton-dependent oligopeptide transporter [Flammeovirgaceae bacterium]|jgi:POT family proton-dependent oligopeptide transporter